ncbi:MAG: response regulator [Candidatus Parcubacteria bacterium]|nr:response regulator [Candidatus Parcubacteria bacterium]
MKKILFIEDEMRLHKNFEELFKTENFELISSYDGESGLKLAEETTPDLILLDLILPRKNGFEVLKELKNNPRLSNIPVIILTNVGGAQDVEKALSLGASAYLEKANCFLDDIFEKIKEILKKYEH